MNFSVARIKDLPAIRDLLSVCGLPTNDLDSHLDHFIVLQVESRMVGCIGLEPEVPLLRSLAVDPDYRNRGFAKELCNQLLDHAKEHGLKEIFLLTDTAAKFFDKVGFERKNREEAPERIVKHKQFTELCPSSAVLMWKKL